MNRRLCVCELTQRQAASRRQLLTGWPGKQFTVRGERKLRSARRVKETKHFDTQLLYTSILRRPGALVFRTERALRNANLHTSQIQTHTLLFEYAYVYMTVYLWGDVQDAHLGKERRIAHLVRVPLQIEGKEAWVSPLGADWRGPITNMWEEQDC